MVSVEKQVAARTVNIQQVAEFPNRSLNLGSRAAQTSV